MKKMTNYACIMLMTTAIFTATVFVSCKKDKEDPSGGNSDVLIEANDSKALGKYSGIIINPSGYYTIELRSSGSKATVVFDGKTYVLDGQGTIEEGKSIANYTFQKDGIKVTFGVGADGKSPKVKIDIPGHEVYATINKETTKYETKSYIGSIKDVATDMIIDQVAVTISNGIVSGFMKVNEEYISISGQKSDSTAYVSFIFSHEPGKQTEAEIKGNKITGGQRYVFDLSKVN